jgi:molybdate/tungstate transport system substrate-binding protein
MTKNIFVCLVIQPILMRRAIIFSVLFLPLIFFTLFISGIKELNATTIEKDVSVMYAGSLVNIFENEIKLAFQNLTGYNFIGEGKGSVQISNMILDGFRKPDVFISADTTPIERLINHSLPLAKWLVKFGSAELVIAYNPQSPFASELWKANNGKMSWYKVLEKKEFKFGRTDPELDPKGYYTVIAAKLANIYYNDSTIKDKILGEDRNKEQILPEEILKSILDSGQIDATAAYKHEAIAKGLPYITLPDQINLSEPNYTIFYNKISYKLETGEIIYGNPIFFSLTIPNTVKNIEGAISFVKFLLSENGRKILEKVGLSPIEPILKGDIDQIKPKIFSLIQEHK